MENPSSEKEANTVPASNEILKAPPHDSNHLSGVFRDEKYTNL
ncbi:MAG: hypothetical protein R2728_01380 [Chitinophagales bacterium]